MRAWSTRTAGRRPVPTAFLDRDGTINPDRAGSYITSPGQFRLYAFAAAAIRLLRAKGYRVIVVTNQSAVGRGYMTLAASRAVNRKLADELRRAGTGVDGVYFCPHRPDEGCRCRKPRPGLIEEARADLPDDPGRSFVAGDKQSDLDLARNAGLKGLLVRTGQWRGSVGAAAAAAGFRNLLALARAVPAFSKTTSKKRAQP